MFVAQYNATIEIWEWESDWFHPTLYWARAYLSMLGSKLIQVNEGVTGANGLIIPPLRVFSGIPSAASAELAKQNEKETEKNEPWMTLQFTQHHTDGLAQDCGMILRGSIQYKDTVLPVQSSK